MCFNTVGDSWTVLNIELVSSIEVRESLSVELEDVYDMNVIAPSIIIPKFSNGKATIKPELRLCLYLILKSQKFT